MFCQRLFLVCSVAFFFSKLSGRHFSDDKVDLFFSLVVKGNQRCSFKVFKWNARRKCFDVDAEHDVPCYLLWRSICLLVMIFLHPTRNCIQWSNYDVLVVTNWLLPAIIRDTDAFYFYDLATKICKMSGAKAIHKLSLLSVALFSSRCKARH